MNYVVESASGWGELIRFRRDMLAYMAQASRRGVDIRCLQFGSHHLFQVNHPELIQDILVTHDWNFIKSRGLRASKPVLGHGLLTSEGELHRRQRRLVQPAFHSSRLAGYAATIVQCATAASRTWVAGNQYALDRQMMRLTLEVVGRTLFSADLQQDADGVGASLKRALQAFMALNSPLAQLLPPIRRWAAHSAARSRHEIESVIGRVIENHLRNPEIDDMLSMLMHAHDDSNTGYMSHELLLDECMTLFLAGHETTANALTWTWYLLAQHPEASERLREELQSVLNGRLPGIEDLPLLDYTGRIFHEALRLYPPAWVIGREAVTEYRLGGVEVPAGSILLMGSYATHRDPRFWPDPERFDPDRWRKDQVAERPKFAFYPFGAGTRVCIGEHFAMMEGILVLATIAQQWRFHLVAGQKVELWPQMTLRSKQPLYFRAERHESRRGGAESEKLVGAAPN